jgi:hypothetical protein
MLSHSVLATWIYNSTRSSVLATLLYHHSIHVASVIPVIPGVACGVVMALVHLSAAGAAVFRERRIARWSARHAPGRSVRQARLALTRQRVQLGHESPAGGLSQAGDKDAQQLIAEPDAQMLRRFSMLVEHSSPADSRSGRVPCTVFGIF